MPTLLLLCAAILVFSVSPGRAGATVDPVQLYGSELRFDVQRKGRTIGSHVVTFHRAGDVLETRSDVRMAIDVLFFNAFRYRYQSHARWRDGRVEDLSVAVDDNGKRTRLVATRAGGQVEVSRGETKFYADAAVQPTEHWNDAILAERRILNTLTAKLNTVDIVRGGREDVPTERGGVPATRFRYTGDLEIDVWYDDAGRWVRMRFKGRDGSTIEYLCRRCQGPGVPS